MSIEKKGQAEMGYLLQSLTSHLSKIVPDNFSAIESWMDSSTLKLSPKNLGLNALEIGMMSYEAVISFERFPFCQFDPAIIMAAVMSFLLENDEYRKIYDLPEPSFDVEAVAEDLANIEFQIDFIEPVVLVADENGPIVWQKKRYKISNYEMWIAEKIKVDFK